jgi:YbbR domain-containing protein
LRSEYLGTKLLAVLIAILLWLQAALINEHRTIIKLPVQLLNSPRDISIDKQPDSIPFVVQGKGIEILRFALSKTKLAIDASQLKPGEDILSLENYSLDIPDNIKLTLVGPAVGEDIKVHAETQKEKRVPVRLSFADEATSAEFSSKTLQISPESILLSGPATELDRIRYIVSSEINRKHSNLTSFRIPLVSPGEKIRMDVTELRVVVSSNQNVTRVINNISLSPSDRQRFFPPRITVKINGDRQLVDSLRSSSLVPIVSETPDALGNHEITIRTPDGINLLDITPEKVRAIN